MKNVSFPTCHTPPSLVRKKILPSLSDRSDQKAGRKGEYKPVRKHPSCPYSPLGRGLYRLWQVLFYLPSQQLSGSPSSKVTQHRSAWWNRYNTNNIWQDNDTLCVLGCSKAPHTYLSLLPWQPQSCSDKWAWSCRGPLFLLILSFNLCFFYKGGRVVRKRGQSRLAGIANVWVTSLKKKKSVYTQKNRFDKWVKRRSVSWPGHLMCPLGPR